MLGAAVILTPAEGVELDPEDSAVGTVCAALANPEQVQRSVNLTFTFTAITAGTVGSLKEHVNISIRTCSKDTIQGKNSISSA